MDDWILKLEQALFRVADGDVSDDDVEFIMANVPKLGDELQEQLQALVDEPHEQRNVQIALGLLAMYKLWRVAG
jgi:hypothetical protein